MSNSEVLSKRSARINYKALAETGSKEVAKIFPKANMANDRIVKLIADIETLFFQMNEMDEDIDDVETMTSQEVVKLHDELKELRVKVVKVHT